MEEDNVVKGIEREREEILREPTVWMEVKKTGRIEMARRSE